MAEEYPVRIAAPDEPTVMLYMTSDGVFHVRWSDGSETAYPSVEEAWAAASEVSHA